MILPVYVLLTFLKSNIILPDLIQNGKNSLFLVDSSFMESYMTD